MEPEGSLPHSQVPATCPYPEPARSSPYPHNSLHEDRWYDEHMHLTQAKNASHNHDLSMSVPIVWIKL